MNTQEAKVRAMDTYYNLKRNVPAYTERAMQKGKPRP
jgi:hypothetical protein